ncbi:MAG: acetyl-CoA hydrolase/transferase family protein [Bacteroidales bacterium]|nr:acetyl-CoA hydrolase/transferase family protein [Bacteroidales bacterium]
MRPLTFVSADEAVQSVKSHDHIHISSAGHVPQILIEALCRRADAGELEDVHFHHSYTEGPAKYSDPKYQGVFFDQAFFVGPTVRPYVNLGIADYIPVHLADTQKLYRTGAVRCDVAMVSVSTPGMGGYVSLGGSVDCSVAALEVARIKIAVVNKYVPHTYGDALIPIDAFDYFVEDSRPLPDHLSMIPSDVEEKIGKNCSELIADGSCLQMGIGALPDALAFFLRDRRDLGVHTEMFSAGILELMRLGVVTGANKKIDRGRVVASFLLGTQGFYKYVDFNRSILMMDIGYVNDPYIISKNPKVVAVNSAVQIDLTGQISADSVGTRIISGTGGQLDFVKGATMSEGGKSITAFPSRAKNGQSKIVPILEYGAGVVTPRADAHWVVTEYGAVDLTGLSLQERAKKLINIAHPEDREHLDRAAFERFGPHYKFVRI